MDDKLHKELLTNLKEALKIVRGEEIATAYIVLTPADSQSGSTKGADVTSRVCTRV